jgi:fucose 4-O-acetylase-like acetyltransferase
MEKQRNSILDIMKGIAIVLVVWGHCLVGSLGEAKALINVSFNICYSFHMALFFAVGGFLLYKTMPTEKYGGWTKKKLIYFIPPHIFMDMWSYVVLLVFPLIPSLLFGPVSVNYWYNAIFYNTNEWFFLTMFAILIVLSFFLRTKIEKLFWLSVVGILAFIIIYPTTTILGINRFQWYIIFALIGFLVAKYFERIKKLWWVLILGCLSYIPVMVLSHWRGGWFMVQPTNLLECILWGDGNFYILQFLQAFGGICIVVCLSFIINKFNIATIFRWLGRYSLAIYVMNPLFIRLGFENGLFRTFTTFIICMGGCIATILLARRFRFLQTWFPNNKLSYQLD